MTIAAIVLVLAAVNLFILSLCRAAADRDDLGERIEPHVRPEVGTWRESRAREGRP